MRALHGAVLVAMIAGLVAQAPFAASADPSAPGATIASDRTDCAPGGTVR
jgi:hypothetical protein